MISVQIFGLKNSSSTRAAERFFKERRAAIHFVDLKVKPMSRGEIQRFVGRFSLGNLIDTEANVYQEAGLAYLKVSDEEMLAKLEREPRLLKMPLVRSGKLLSIGHDEDRWKDMLSGGNKP